MDQIRENFRRSISGLLGIAVITLLVVIAFSGPAVAHAGDDGTHHHDGWMGTHGGMDGWMVGGAGIPWMLLGTFLLIGVPVVAYVLLTRRESTSGTANDDALALLRKRYARGDIDEEEFETRRANLLADQS
jgi:putative membrane protein